MAALKKNNWVLPKISYVFDLLKFQFSSDQIYGSSLYEQLYTKYAKKNL